MTRLSTLGMVVALSRGTALAGCAATTTMAPSQLDMQARTLAPRPDRGIVYLYRSEAFGGAVKMPVLMDGVYSGETVPHAYLLWQLAPGRHTVTSKAENDERLELNIEPGRTYFVWQEVKMGVLMARSRLHLVPDAEGRNELASCRLIDMPPASQSLNAGPGAVASGPTALQP